MAARGKSRIPGNQPAEALYTVTQLAGELGITPRALRFYEDKGLITPRRVGNTRVYARRERARMKLILRGKQLGFSLREIKDYLDLYDVDRTQVTQLRLLLANVRDRIARLHDQRKALDQTLAELRSVEQQTVAALEEKAGDRGKVAG